MDVMNGLHSKGVVMQGYNDEGTQAPWLSSTTTQTAPTGQNQPKKPLLQRIASKVGSLITGDSGAPPVLGPVGQVLGKAVEGVDWSARAGDIVNSIMQPQQDVMSGQGKNIPLVAKDIATAGLTAVGNVTGGAMDIFGQIFQHIPGFPQAASYIMNNATAGPGGVKLGDIIPKAQDAWNKFQLNHPEAAKDLGNVFNVGGALLGNAAEPAATQVVKTGVEGGVSAVADAASKAKSAIVDSVSGKTLEEVLATPESDVPKLSPKERTAWFDNQQEQVSNAKTVADQKVKADLAAKLQASQTEAETLNRQLQTSSRDKVIELRPKIRTALAQQSQVYRQMVDEAIAPYTKTQVSGTELQQFVNSRFPDNPSMAEAVNNRLGLTGSNVAEPLQPGELPSVQQGEDIAHGGKFNTSKADTTLGDIYNKTKSLRQDIGTAANKGTRVYTADEKLTDDAISILSDFMKSKGVDLSEPNKFWAQYAPVRNQLVSEAKPFLQADTQTKTFANTLMRVAKGTDVNNENFINEVENLVGEPVNSQNKSIISKMTANEKQSLADEVDAQEKLAQNKLDAEKASGKISQKQFEAERLASKRTIMRRIFYTAGGLGVDKIIKKYTGIGI